MGYVSKSRVEHVALFLIELLKEKGSVDFDYFYDGTDETEMKLNKALEYPKDDEESVILMDIAISELEDMGIVETKQLSSKLADDEFNYRTRLTYEGEKIIKSGQKMEFRDLDL